MNELIDALRSEAKLLLLFLRSVHTIEVYDIDQYGGHNLSFQAKITDNSVAEVKQKRSSLIRDLKSYHASYQYNFSAVLSFTANFGVAVYDASTHQTITSHWLVANQVGSTNPSVRKASVKQMVFPWVGVALEKDKPGDGRIFCFLPMPIETASNLPIHVNGTFGLNDDRRNLKWPGVERRNDTMANWNAMLVKEVLPSCYASLLLEYKSTSDSMNFYKAWPNVTAIKHSQWEPLLVPLYSTLVRECVIWCHAPGGYGEWNTPNLAVFVPKTTCMETVMKNTLIACKVKLAEAPSIIWDALSYVSMEVTKVTPKFARDNLISNPHSFSGISAQDKKVLLKYCLSDGQFTDLAGLNLLPLVNNKFVGFQSNSYYMASSSLVYMCTGECPKWLLPNLKFKLVDVTDDSCLHGVMLQVAQQQCTQLRELTVSCVASLLDESMSMWRNHNTVTFPNSKFPSNWLSNFWDWIRNKMLKSFENKLVFPVHSAHNISISKTFQVVRLISSLPLLFFHSRSNISGTLLSALDKLNIQYCTEANFTYVRHSQLSSIVKEYSPEALLDVITLRGSYSNVTFTNQEADLLRKEFCKAKISRNMNTVKNLKIFSSCGNSKNALYSITQVTQSSILGVPAMEPTDSIDLKVLPSNAIILSTSDYYQTQLIRKLGYLRYDGVYFLEACIFPKLTVMGEHYIDAIMTRVLDLYPTLANRNYSITTSLQNLYFVKVGNGTRLRPCDLYDPSNSTIALIFTGQAVFPCSPYNSTKYINILRSCGLQSSIDPRTILNLIYSLSQQKSYAPIHVDSTKLTGIRAIMQYVSKKSFTAPNKYTVDRRIVQGYVSFKTALLLLSQNRSWLPVLSERPAIYPSALPWKGEHFSSHVISLGDTVCTSNSHSSTAPLLYGSQAYFTESFDSLEQTEPRHCLVPHFQQVMAYNDNLTPEQTLTIIKQLYSVMLTLKASHLSLLKHLKEWVYIMTLDKFVSIDSVALRRNSEFRHSLEPYLHILPDSISAYSKLFTNFGMSHTLSQAQILSVLGTLRSEINSGSCSVCTEEAWSLVLSILNWVSDNGTKEVSEDIVDYIFVPAESCRKLPSLKGPQELVYTDSEVLKEFAKSTDNDKPFVHDRINQSLAKYLGVTPLSEELGISEDTFEDAGQHEPLIVRLKNILKDYKDGLTIIKELIQNADDAGATVVKICFDARKHEIQKRKIFFPDMCEAHGPALVIYNNSIFSDEDFANIQKLAGATKQTKHLKIGKFGIGFCSVYHITDVPSFISRERLYIFDPTLRHLKKAVKNPNQPGKKVNFLSKVIQKSLQMQPYEGLFDFDSTKEYEGTLFRLPFRADPSELSSTCYSESTINELITDIKETSDKLLLFLQNVRRITVQRFDEGMLQPRTLFEVHKPSNIPSISLSNASIAAIETWDHKSRGKSSNYWLFATRRSMYENSKPAVANVACQLYMNPDNTYSVNSSLAGEIFCFLPLSLITGLPVHVSCNFAVINNRRGIWTNSHGNSYHNDEDVEWNIFLMKKVIPVAYIQLLLILQIMDEHNLLLEYKFCCLWPLTTKLLLRNPWEQSVVSFYSSLLSNRLFYSHSIKSWLQLKDCIFLDPIILGQASTIDSIKRFVFYLGFPVVDLPDEYRSHINLTTKCLTEKKFIDKFFSCLSQLNSIESSRNSIILYMLETYATQFDRKTSTVKKQLSGMFSYHACIPTSPDGKIMRKCEDIVNPMSSFAKLFEDSDHHFPLKMFSERHLAMAALRHAGMMHDTLSWKFIIERAQNVEQLMMRDQIKSLSNVQLIISIISHGKVQGSYPNQEPRIDSIPFLPVMPKPETYPLTWFGDKCRLLPGKLLTLIERHGSVSTNVMERISGNYVAFLCEKLPQHGGCGFIYDKKTLEMLGLKSSPTFGQVIAQLKQIVHLYNQLKPEWITETCSDIYRFFENTPWKAGEHIVNLDELKAIPLVWNGKKFLSIEFVSHNWKLDCGPYLFKVPPNLSSNLKLSEALGIKKEFTYYDGVMALEKMKADFKDSQINDQCMQLIKELIVVFEDAPPEELREVNGLIFLPDETQVLYKSSALSYNDTDWIPLQEGCVQVHSLFSKDLAIRLGVNLTRSKLAEQYLSKNNPFTEFGQHEDLTTRIQGIIRDYDFDITIVKELLQNADDAKSSQVCFILDRRTHGSKSILSEKWKELQGPALLVWNDSVFTEKDYEGIQKLGLGSKRYNEETIGQYGIGFNVVYHLTDCPSFISDGDTLCIFDPHCQYTLGTNERRPGVMYDNLKKGFWIKFADMSAAYLQDGSDKVPGEFHRGTLFRFPLRHTLTMAVKSQIIDHRCSKAHGQIQPEELSRLMHKWMPSVKQSIFFLNHVIEVKYMEISEKGVVETKFHCKAVVEKSSESFQGFQNAVSGFTAERNQSFTIHYQITVTEFICNNLRMEDVVVERKPKENIVKRKQSEDIVERKSKVEKWLIQQSIGDMQDESQYWQYIETVKPRHAIAVPLRYPQDKKWTGQLFCFLPLPSLSSDIPAHINGSFILDSHRRALWKSSDPNREDDKSRWNGNLFLAIASSYAHFLVQARNTYVKCTYANWHEALNDLHNYYCLFPDVHFNDRKKGSLSVDIYKKLIKMNAKVLCVLVSHRGKDHKVSVEWHPLISQQEAKQVYFWSYIKGDGRKIIHPVLESIGMKITSAPPPIMKSLNSVIRDERKHLSEGGKLLKCETRCVSEEDDNCRIIPPLSPASLFKYYTKYSKFSPLHNMKECFIERTVFKTASNFLLFTKYLLEMKLEHDTNNKDAQEASKSVNEHVFAYEHSVLGENRDDDDDDGFKTRRYPESPFSHFLLLSADGVLKSFDIVRKVLKSEFFTLFPNHKGMFLHPEFRSINYDKSYFVTLYQKLEGNEIVENNDDEAKILKLFQSALPQSLYNAKVISKASAIISKDRLAQFWKCLLEDEVISSYCPQILSSFALLLTTDNRLFSTNNNVLPSFKPPVEKKHIGAIMKAMEMPFLNDSIDLKTSELPSLSKHDKILSNFFHTNEIKPLSSVLRSNTSHFDALISYFSEAAKPSEAQWVHQISSLPFFVDILGLYLPIASKRAHLWPRLMCKSGYSNWVKDGDIFIQDQDQAKWTSLGSADHFKIKHITEEDIYLEFIFPRFHCLSDSERYEHLEFIKHSMYNTCKYYSQQELTESTPQDVSNKINNARAFIEKLKLLNCIESEDGNLMPVSAFVDRSVDLFISFSNYFQILPEQYKSKEWLAFLKDIGLQQMPSMQRFLELCRDVQDQKVKNVKESSNVLLRYVFSTSVMEKWLSKAYFLFQVSKLLFVPASDTSQVSWIAPSKSEKNELVCLHGATTGHLKCLLWTVNPIIYLPCEQYKLLHDAPTVTMLKRLQITTRASYDEVAQNLKNICKCRTYSDERLFEKYPQDLIAPQYSTSLLKVMTENFKFFMKNGCSPNSEFEDLPCIPVYCDLISMEEHKMALVKPSSVISYTHGVKTLIPHFHPYLHKLPSELNCTMQLLTTIGVKSNLDIHHMQIVLEKIYEHSQGQTLDPNAQMCVKMALEYLFKHFPKACPDDLLADQLCPLYLPDTKDQLRLSTNMLYSDTFSYFCDMDLDLSGTGYSHFNIIEKYYGVCALDICHLLPEKVRPKAMSIKCKQIPDDECKTVEHTDLVQSMEVALHHESNSLAIVKACTINLNWSADAELESLVHNFIESLTIKIKQNMKTQIILRESGKKIGQTSSKFYFESCDVPRILYIDADFDEDDLDDVYTEVADALCDALRNQYQLVYSTSIKKLSDFIKNYLKAKPSRKAVLLQRHHIILPICSSSFFRFELGETIPEIYHHRLDQDFNNIFRPMEYVGYEGSQNHIIVAQIVHLVLSDNNNPNNQLAKKYYIYTNTKLDEEGKIVSILNLYKIVYATSTSNSGDAEERSLVLHVGMFEAMPIESDLSEIKARLLKNLKEIWNLDLELRNRAVRRLYLKWHPDKNLKNLEKAQEIFLFLKREINRLEEANNTSQGSHDEAGIVNTQGKFYRWDRMASCHRDAEQEEAANMNIPSFEGPVIKPRPEEGRRWVEQAKTDFNVLCSIHDWVSDTNGYGYVCFMAHQVAEKALKGGIYVFCGMDDRGLRDHKLGRHAHALVTVVPVETVDLIQSSIPLESYYLDTRYPNCWSGYRDTPADHYTEHHADVARRNAKRVLDIVKNITQF